MHVPADSGVSSGLARVRARFVDELQGRRARIGMLRADLDHAAQPMGALTGIRQIAHKIAGTAATLGFPDLGALAAEIDDTVLRLSVDGCPPSQALVARIDRMLAMMDTIIASRSDDA